VDDMDDERNPFLCFITFAPNLYPLESFQFATH